MKNSNSQNSANYEVGYKKPPKNRQFGQKDGNKRGHGFFTVDKSLRYRLQRVSKMSVEELKDLLCEPDAAEYEKNIARTILEMSELDAEKRWRVLEGLTNQDSGFPKQQIDNRELPPLTPILPKPKPKKGKNEQKRQD